MPRQRSPNRDRAFEIYREHGGNITNRAIAEILGEDEKVVAVWKSRDRWNVVQQSAESCTTNKPKAHGGQPGNQNAVGHGAPLRNRNAEKHGLFSKWLPAEAMEIMQAIEAKSPLDMLWDQIMLQYTAIIRAQNIMYVRDKNDLTKEISMAGDGVTAWDVQQAWDKQAKFLQAQSTAMKTLNGMIKQYEEMLRSDLATEELRMRIAKLKAETGRLTGEGLDTEDISEIEGDIFGGLKDHTLQLW